MKRRNFFKGAAATGIVMTGMGSTVNGTTPTVSNASKFKLKYAPGLSIFIEHAGKDPVDNIKFIADQGFTAIFDNGLMRREPEIQEKIANEASRLGLDIGPFGIYGEFGVKSFVFQDPEIKEMLKKKMLAGVEAQKRTGVNQALVVPGHFDEKLHWDYQTANVIDNMRMCCDIVGKTGLELVMEPLNPHTDHPGLFLTRMPQAKLI